MSLVSQQADRSNHGLTTVGHVLGLAHEHQRQDARDNIVFKCENLDYYEKAKNWLADKKKVLVY